ANHPVTVFNHYQIDENLSDLQQFDLVIVGYHKVDGVWKKHDLASNEVNLLDAIAKDNKTIFVSFVKPYALSAVKDFKHFNAVVLGYQNNVTAHRKAIDVIFGMQGAKGKLPVSIGS